MNQTFTLYHQNRYEWAYNAQREFIYSFVVLHVQDTEPTNSKEILNLDVDVLTFRHLTECYNVAEKTMNRVLEEYEKEINRLDHLIKRQYSQIDIELKKANIREEQFSIEIKNYKDFFNHIENLIIEIKAIEMEPYVNELIPFHSNHKKASILNSYASKLQLLVQSRIEKELTEIKDKAQILTLISVDHLQLPELDSIPKIQPVMDSFWLNSSYEKSLYTIRNHACDWLVKIYNAYIDLLMNLQMEITQEIHNLGKEKEALKQMKDETLNRLQKTLSMDKEKRDLLTERQNESQKVWKQDCENAKQLQGYFIKHWLLYKKELERQFLYAPLEERWLISQYLLLLQQDGKRIIESMNIGDE